MFLKSKFQFWLRYNWMIKINNRLLVYYCFGKSEIFNNNNQLTHSYYWLKGLIFIPHNRLQLPLNRLMQWKFSIFLNVGWITIYCHPRPIVCHLKNIEKFWNIVIPFHCIWSCYLFQNIVNYLNHFSIISTLSKDIIMYL